MCQPVNLQPMCARVAGDGRLAGLEQVSFGERGDLAPPVTCSGSLRCRVMTNDVSPSSLRRTRWTWSHAVFRSATSPSVSTAGRPPHGLFAALVSLFLLAIEPGVNAWRRGGGAGRRPGHLVGVLFALWCFVANSARRPTDRRSLETREVRQPHVNFINDTSAPIDAQQVIDEINREDGAVQRFIRSQSGKVVTSRWPPWVCWCRGSQ